MTNGGPCPCSHRLSVSTKCLTRLAVKEDDARTRKIHRTQDAGVELRVTRTWDCRYEKEVTGVLELSLGGAQLNQS